MHPALVWLLCALVWTLRASTAADAATNTTVLSFSEARFSSSAPYASDSALARRFGIKTPPLGYQIANERFRVGVPNDNSTNHTYGLFVWVSPGEAPRIPAAWEHELAKRKMLFVSAYASGNERNAIERCRLALDATYNLCRQYRIDPEQIHIAGFSGGGRIASILGVSCADIFTGCLAICGVDFYLDVRSPAKLVYTATYRVDPQLLARARNHGRFVLLTGERDENRDNTKATVENGFLAQRFRHVRYMEIAGWGHALPSAAVFASALEFLESRDVKGP